MRRLHSLILTSIFIGISLSTSAAELKSGEYFITQSWSQERDFKRSYHVKVPANNKGQKLPVFVFLHGNGGNAQGAMNGITRRYRNMARRYVMVFANGYQKSWNIVSERSKADDRGFIEAIVERLTKFDNVRRNDFTIMGSSNGAALVNQMAIECQLPNVKNYISAVSPLNSFQHDGVNFKAKGEKNNYQVAMTPMKGKRLLNISGTEDRLVPYRGGPSRVIPAKGGKLAFVDAEESIFLWAQAMGYKGPKLTEPNQIEGDLQVFSYLNGNVIHYKAVGKGHNATGALTEKMLLDFSDGRSAR